MSNATAEFLDFQAALAGEYSLERELGRGGMGVVYLARDVLLDRNVAIKVLPSHLAAQPEFRERFLREARTAASLSHPNIVPIHRVVEAGGYVFFVMSYVPGKTLGDRLREKGALSAAEVMRMLREVSWALAYAHGRGIVHRDIKPDNILLEEDTGRALVTDFGIARVLSAASSTEPMQLMGTAQFMSPEQVSSETIDGRSDLYALGVVGYLATSGRLPFDGANLPALLMKHVTEDAPPLDDVAPGAPRALSAAIHRCLEKDPENRFADGEALAASLAPANEGRPQMPATLRTWLAARNPANGIYAAWSGLMIIPMLSDISNYVNYHHVESLINLGTWCIVAAAPLLLIVGFHATRARKLFDMGFTLADLRGALDVAEQERKEAEGPVTARPLTASGHVLRRTLYGSMSGWAFLMFVYPMLTLGLEKRHILIPLNFLLSAELATAALSVALVAAANVFNVPIIPSAVRKCFSMGIGERLWRSRAGMFLSKKLGAPEKSRPVATGVFQPTEVALSIAASDLFASLPTAYRNQLSDLPAVAAALEARAAGARAELDVLDAEAYRGGRNAGSQGQKEAAQAQLASCVGALEGLRIDLLRLSAGATDLRPLTTLIDEARRLSDDVHRLSAAQEEVWLATPRLPRRAERVPTPV